MKTLAFGCFLSRLRLIVGTSWSFGIVAESRWRERLSYALAYPLAWEVSIPVPPRSNTGLESKIEVARR